VKELDYKRSTAEGGGMAFDWGLASLKESRCKAIGRKALRSTGGHIKARVRLEGLYAGKRVRGIPRF